MKVKWNEICQYYYKDHILHSHLEGCTLLKIVSYLLVIYSNLDCEDLLVNMNYSINPVTCLYVVHSHCFSVV